MPHFLVSPKEAIAKVTTITEWFLPTRLITTFWIKRIRYVLSFGVFFLKRVVPDVVHVLPWFQGVSYLLLKRNSATKRRLREKKNSWSSLLNWNSFVKKRQKRPRHTRYCYPKVVIEKSCLIRNYLGFLLYGNVKEVFFPIKLQVLT